ncbi:MAG: Lsr2 dimerization domain-containing protein [Acidimicrobiales bacterium]
MAIRITRIDDIDGSDGAEAIAFELDHKAYEIDLCVRNRLRFTRVLEPFIERARLIDDREQESTITTIVGRTPPERVRLFDALPADEPPAGETSGDLDLVEMARKLQS